MSEAEILETMTQYFSLVAEMLTLYFTATTGYLIIIYMVGANLTRSQLTIASGLYLAFAIIATYLTIGYAFRGIHYSDELRKLNPSTPMYATPSVPIALAIVLGGGIIASLKFMWDIRYPRSE